MSVIAPVRPESPTPPPTNPHRPSHTVPDAYREAVTKLALDKEDRRFLNDSCEHAKLLADLMIGNSQEDDCVRIYSGELSSDCYRDALISSKAREIRVLLDSSSGTSVIDALPNEAKSRIKAKVLTAKDGNHFFIAGDAFRYELNHDDATAIANFNEPLTVQKLMARFDRQWNSVADA